MTESEFQNYREIALADSRDITLSGAWKDREEALERFNETFSNGLQTSGISFLAIREVEQTVGFLLYTSASRGLRRECFILDLHVLPAFRRRGHASMALARLRDLVTPLGYDHIGLSVMPGNDAGHSLYRQCGFRPAFTRYHLPLTTT